VRENAVRHDGTAVARRGGMLRMMVVAVAVFGTACTAEVVDELAGESPEDGEATGKADADASFTFFTASPDLRQCSLDARCGGFFVARPNRATTTCGRGQTGARCYVDGLDWSGTALPASVAASFEERVRAGEPMLLRGDISPAPDDRGSVLAVTEVWTAGSETGEPVAQLDGVFVLVKDNGIRCITAPCPSLGETRLNSTRSANIHAVDLEASGADAGAIERAMSDIFGGDGVIVVGDRYYGKKKSKGRAAHQFFTRAPVPLH
jgi:hypothetical protein